MINALIGKSRYVRDVTESRRQWKTGTCKHTEWAREQRIESIDSLSVDSDGNLDRNNEGDISS